jgi:hypothetical protein|tara:strand:- start:57 stop:614 length:558 start_codon:yes stop_codon:yes gene_type:complete
MNYLNYMHKFFFTLVTISLILFLQACSIWDPADARKVSPNSKERVKKNLEEGKGMTLGGNSNNNTSYQFATSNPMWRATLEILDFLPLANVDYSGGVVSTDWYNETGDPDEYKITVRFLTNEIRTDGIKIIVHKRQCELNTNCRITKISSTLEKELQVAILKKASIYSKNDKKNKKKKVRPELKD